VALATVAFAWRALGRADHHGRVALAGERSIDELAPRRSTAGPERAVPAAA